MIKTFELTRPFAVLIYARNNDEHLFIGKVISISGYKQIFDQDSGRPFVGFDARVHMDPDSICGGIGQIPSSSINLRLSVRTFWLIPFKSFFGQNTEKIQWDLQRKHQDFPGK